jgi:hypothetical protein
MKKHTLVAPLLATLSFVAPLFAQTPLQDTFKTLTDDERAYFQHVTTLSNPYFEGRAPGLRGNQLAAEYVEFNFRKIGLTPAFPSAKGEGDAADAAKTPFASFLCTLPTGLKRKMSTSRK